MSRDSAMLDRAIAIARTGAPGTRPNPLVGAVLATPTSVLAEAAHMRHGGPHAERAAFATWGDTAVPADATMYVSLEPCAHHGRQPPCAELLVERGVRRVVVAAADPNPATAGRGPELLRAAGVEVLWGTTPQRDAAVRDNAPFHSSFVRHRPWVVAKWACTADGALATGDPDNRWVSGEAARAEVHLLRACSGAVAVGIGTVLADDPLLTVRGTGPGGALLADRMPSPPIRVVLDRHLQLPLDSMLVRTVDDAPVLVACAADADSAGERRLRDAGVDVVRLLDPAAGGPFDALLAELHDRGVQQLLLEPGPRLLAATFAAGIIDQLTCYRAPNLLTVTDGLPRLGPDEPIVRALPAAASRLLPGGDEVYDRDCTPLAALLPA